MTRSDSDRCARDRFDRPDLCVEPVQGTASRVNSGMADPVVDQTREVPEDVGAPDPTPESHGGFGDEAVPLRPAADRDAEVEREEVLRLVAAVSPGESLLRRHHRTVIPALASLALIAVAVTQIGGGGDRLDQHGELGGATTAAKEPPIATRTNPSGPAPTIADSESAIEPRRQRHRQTGSRRRHHSNNHRGQQDRPAQQATAATASPGPEPTAAPESEPEWTPETESEPASAPEPEPAPAPQQAQPSPSPPSNQTTEESQVESQFGFEQ